MIRGPEIYENMPLAWVLLLILVMDLIIGDPKVLYDRLPHPVVWMGKLLSILDALGNRENYAGDVRRISGVICLIIYLGFIFTVSYYLNRMIISIPSPEMALLVLTVTSSFFLSSRSLISHVKAVERPLAKGNIAQARTEVAMIVGRKTEKVPQCRLA